MTNEEQNLETSGEILMSSNRSLTLGLQRVIQRNESDLKTFVAEWILSHYPEDIQATIEDILNFGCVSGMVSCLIYYEDTHAFFDEYQSEIEDLFYEYQEATGSSLKMSGDIKNWLAWSGFEQMTYNLSCELGVDF